MTFWIDGAYQDNPATIDIADRGFLLGDGVFETLLVERGAPAFLDEHLSRLRAGLEALQIDMGAPPDWRGIIAELASRNGLCDIAASARLTVSRGVSGRGLAAPPPEKAKPVILITLTRAQSNAAGAPLALMASAFRRAEASISARHKTLNYIDNIMALNEARRAGFDDAVMLNSKGRVACTSSANIFIISEKGVATPVAEEGALAGIVRGELLEGAREMGLEAETRRIAPEELMGGAPFLTNSLMGLRPARIRNADEANSSQTEIFNMLAAWYHRRLGEDLEQNRAVP